MKRLFLISAILLCGAFSASAQSTIYLCCEKSDMLVEPLPIKINNQEVFLIASNLKKECTMYSEGKLIISCDKTMNSTILGTQILRDEIQLTLSKNSVHYILIKRVAGFNGWIDFRELTTQEGKKEFASRKYKPTPNYVEPHSDNPAEQTGGKVPQRSKEPVATSEAQTQE